MPERFDSLYRVKRAGGLPEALTEQFFNVRFQDVDLRIAALEALDIAWQAALLQVRGEVLDRAETVISDLRDQLVELTQLQWLTALSGRSVTLEADEVKSFAIDPDYRDLFTPGPFVMLSRAANADDYAVGRTISYDRESGQLDVEIIVITGNAGPHNDWVIAAIAGSTLAQLELLDEARGLEAGFIAARDAAVAAAATATIKAGQSASDRTAVADDKAAVAADRTTTVAAKDEAVAAAASAAATASAIAGGPVASVAGLSGIVGTPALKAALGIATDISAAINGLLGGAGGAYDTLKELQDLIVSDQTAATALTALVGTKANSADVLPRSKIVARIIAYGG